VCCRMRWSKTGASSEDTSELMTSRSETRPCIQVWSSDGKPMEVSVEVLRGAGPRVGEQNELTTYVPTSYVADTSCREAEN